MRIAIVSDIHEDIRNLEKAMKKIKVLGYDALLCLGDITGFAPVFYNHEPDANACIEMLRSHSAISVVGNHDLFTVGRLPSYHNSIGMAENWYNISFEDRKKMTFDKVWVYNDEILPDLTPENKHYLNNLEEHVILETKIGNVLFSHFLKPDMAGATKWFPFKCSQLKEHFGFIKQNDCKVAICAHSHQAGIAVASKFLWFTLNYEHYRVKSSRKIIICPPIVSGKSIAGFVIFDSQKGILSPHVV